jgi:hypothetical protein
MATLAQIASDIKKSMEGSISGSDSRFTNSYIEYLVPQLRSECIVESFNGSRTRAGNKFLDPSLYQAVTLTKDPDLQNTSANFLYFEIGSSPVILDNRTNGLYLGNLDATSSFTQVRTLGELNILQNKGYRQGLGEYYYMAYGTGVRLYGNKALRTIYCEIIAENPASVTGFNSDTDEYPIAEDMMSLLIEKAKARLLLQVQRPADIIDNESVNK